MMRAKKLKAVLLSFLIVCGIALESLPVFAAEDANAADATAKEDQAATAEEETLETIDYYKKVYRNPQEKLDTMTLFYEAGDYQVWVQEYTGEVGFVDLKTGQIILSNPYDVGSVTASDEVKARLLSQVVLKYTDSSKEYTFTSYGQGAVNKQIKAKKVRGGVRVEYTLGREEVKKLVPRLIEKSRLEEAIFDKVENPRDLKKLKAYYMLKDASDPNLSNLARNSLLMTLPITEKYAVYVLDPGIVERELYDLEAIISATGYTFDDLDADHALVEYEGTEKAPALFKFALEYYIDEEGIQVRLPANGIRYDSANYSLTSMQILPYLGAGNHTKDTGYTMIPDGSGTIVRFEDIKDKTFTMTGKLYGQDFSFHSISGSNQETMRLPAYGVVKTETYETGGTLNEETGLYEDAQQVTQSSGFIAYLEEGDSMAEVSTDHGGKTHAYSSVYPTFYPRPKDTYALTGISSTGSATWTVDSDRKYTGNYTIRILPLYEENANYIGMANSLRQYLIDTGVLKKLEDDGKDGIPLYIENFGIVRTQQKVFGIPINEQTPLTTFQQCIDMLEQLKGEGITNVNVKYTGWYNGGLWATVPARLKVERNIGGNQGLKDLVSYAKDNQIGLYPNLEFVHVDRVGWFDSFNYKNDSVKTIDNRSAVYREYSALYQGYMEADSLLLSPPTMQRLYNKVIQKYQPFEVGGLSVGNLGMELNSDHNEDYPLNREDSKEMIQHLLAQMQEDNGSLMIDGGNAYALPYADHILEVPLDSSRNINTSEAIPFMGMVLHGYKEFAGTAINQEGDFAYSLLKTIENGASPYFMLSLSNTSELKTAGYNNYYSIRYDIWYDDLIDTYNTLNDALGDVRYATISNHETIATRVVRVEYSNGVGFILNYNNGPVEIDGKTIEANSFIKYQTK